MKKLQLLAVLTFLIVSSDAIAQYGYGQPYSPGGVDRTIDTQRNAPDTYNKNAKDKKVDIVALAVDDLNKKLKLDDFQKAAITSIYKENIDKLTAISEEDTSFAAKKDKTRIISEKIDKQIIALLSKEQVEKYKKIIEDRE